MDYSLFKRIATKYIEEHHEGLSVLSSYNPYVQNKVHIYMVNLMLSECGQDAQKTKEVFNECKAHENRFFKECLK